MGLREIDEGARAGAQETGSYDFSGDLRVGSWDYAGQGAARAVDWSSDLHAERGVAEARADAASAADAAYQAASSAAAVREVSSALAAVHAVDAARTARAQFKKASDLGSAQAASATTAADMAAAQAAHETCSACAAAETSTAAIHGAVITVNLNALQSGMRAKTASKLRGGALQAAGAAAELASGNDVGEGMYNAATGEAKGYVQRRATRLAASKIGKARAERAARKAAKAAGKAGAATAKGSAAAAACEPAAAATAAPAAGVGAKSLARRTGASIAAKAKSLFKPLPPLSTIASKIGIGAGAGVSIGVPFLMVFGILVLLFALVAGTSAFFGDEASKQNTGELQGNEKELAQLLKSYDLDDVHIAAIMGNFACESHCNPKIVQYGFGYDGIDQDDYPPELIDNGQCGYGLAQWTYPSRSWGLVNLAKALGKHSGDMDVQVKYLFEGYGESEEFGPYLDSFKARDDIESATRYFHEVFEMSNDDEERIQNRVKEAKRIYAALQGSGTAAGGEDYDSASARQKLLADKAAAGDGFGYSGGYCEAWAETCYRRAIGPCDYKGCATEACWAWKVSDSGSVPVGAAVFGHSTGPVYDGGHDAGHVAIYIGNGNTIGLETGGPIVRSLDEWISIYGYSGWGWMNGDDLR